MASTATANLVDVRLHGSLADRFGRSFKLAISTPREAVRALAANLPGFTGAWLQCPGYSVLVNGQAIRLEEVDCERTLTTIDFVPQLAGAKDGGDMLILGAALLILSGPIGWIGAGGSMAAGFFSGVGAAGFAGVFAAGVFNLGLSMIFMGIATELDGGKNANDSESAESKTSQLFNGAVNTTANGRCVPVCYGELGVGSHVISAGFSTEDRLTD